MRARVCVCVCVCVCVSSCSTAAFSGRVVLPAETQRGRRNRDIMASPVTVNQSSERVLSSIAYANRQLVGRVTLSVRSGNRLQGKMAQCSWQNSALLFRGVYERHACLDELYLDLLTCLCR